MNDLLNRIRLAEEFLDNYTPAKTISKPNTTKTICPMADRVCYRSDNLYKCLYSRKCDYQISFGMSNLYCRKELETDDRANRVEKYSSNNVKNMENKI